MTKIKTKLHIFFFISDFFSLFGRGTMAHPQSPLPSSPYEGSKNGFYFFQIFSQYFNLI
jgi:hypothetical protein